MCNKPGPFHHNTPHLPLPDGCASHTKLCNAPSSTKYYTGSAGGSTKRFILGSSVVSVMWVCECQQCPVLQRQVQVHLHGIERVFGEMVIGCASRVVNKISLLSGCA